MMVKFKFDSIYFDVVSWTEGPIRQINIAGGIMPQHA